MGYTIIGASIDLLKIDKSKIKNHANGSKYYSLTLILDDEPDQYGNHLSIIEPQTKEQRDAKEKKVYIGNGKVLVGNKKPAPSKGKQEVKMNSKGVPDTNTPDDLNF